LGNKWELFAMHCCGDIPLAAVFEKLQPVCLGRKKANKNQYFCRYEYKFNFFDAICWLIEEFGFRACPKFRSFQECSRVQERVVDCSECREKMKLKAIKTPTRIGKSQVSSMRPKNIWFE